MTNKTALFLGPEYAWSKAGIELQDVQPLFGGVRVKLPTWTIGRAFITRVAPGGEEKKYRLTLGLDEKRDLCQLFVDQDFLTIQPEMRHGVPDEGQPSITLTNRRYESHAVAKWTGTTDDRFDALYASLLALAERTVGQEPVKPRLHAWQKGLFLSGIALIVLLSLLPAIWGARRLVATWWPDRVGWLVGLLLVLLLAVIVGVRILAWRERQKMRWDGTFGKPLLIGVINLLFFCATIGMLGMVESLIAVWRTGSAFTADDERALYAVFAYSTAFAIPILLFVAALMGKRVLRFMDERF